MDCLVHMSGVKLKFQFQSASGTTIFENIKQLFGQETINAPFSLISAPVQCCECLYGDLLPRSTAVTADGGGGNKLGTTLRTGRGGARCYMMFWGMANIL